MAAFIEAFWFVLGALAAYCVLGAAVLVALALLGLAIEAHDARCAPAGRHSGKSTIEIPADVPAGRHRAAL